MTGPNGTIMIVGGGLAGMQASLDLTPFVEKVLLIEASPTLGGHVRLLGKLAPTMDDAAKIVQDKMNAVKSNSKIDVLNFSRVAKAERDSRRFRVTVASESVPVDTGKCTSCGKCASICPMDVPAEYEMGLRLRKAAYRPNPPSFPETYAIDKSTCLYFKDRSCRACQDICPEKAIDLEVKSSERTVHADAIILATGFNLYDAQRKGEYGYGRFKNVITGTEYEQLYKETGPTRGRILKVSERSEPSAVGFVLCVGSRDETEWRHCCRVGCVDALKHSSVLKNQYADKCEAYVYCTDLRAVGPMAEEYYLDTRQAGVIFIRGQPSEIAQNPDGSLNIEVFDSATSKLLSTRVDLAVLETEMVPNTNLKEVLELPTREDGFYSVVDMKTNPIETRVKGVFLAGTSYGPKDVSETLMHASAASLKVIEYLERSH